MYKDYKYEYYKREYCDMHLKEESDLTQVEEDILWWASTMVEELIITDCGIQHSNTDIRGELLHSVTQQGTMISFIILNSIPGYIQLLQTLGFPIEIPKLIKGWIFRQ